MIGGGYFQFLEISVFFIHRKLRPMNEKALRSGAFFNNKISAECELYCFDNMVLQQVIREWRLG